MGSNMNKRYANLLEENFRFVELMLARGVATKDPLDRYYIMTALPGLMAGLANHVSYVAQNPWLGINADELDARVSEVRWNRER